MLGMFIEEIIEYASENSAGTLLDKDAIDKIAKSLIEIRNLNKDYIDKLIAENETESGYMSKTNDFIYVLKPYIIGDDSDFEGQEKPEKDYELIEALYGDWHAECGDRD